MSIFRSRSCTPIARSLGDHYQTKETDSNEKRVVLILHVLPTVGRPTKKTIELSYTQRVVLLSMPIKNRSNNIPNFRNSSKNTTHGNQKGGSNVQNRILTNIPDSSEKKNRNNNANNGKKGGNNTTIKNNSQRKTNANLRKKYYVAGSNSTPSLW